MPALPDEFEINRVTINNNNVIVSSESRSLITLQRKVPGQRWDFTLRSVLMDYQTAQIVWAFLAGREQDLDTIQITLPVFSYSDVPDKVTSAAANIGATTVTVTSSSGLEVGRYMQFTGHEKVYLVTDINANEIKFAPNLVRSVASGESITFNDITWSCKLRGRPQEFSAQANRDSVEMELDLVEAL